MKRSKKIKAGKLSGPSHKKGGILLEAEGGEYIIKKSSVKKIGKKTLDKINKEGKLPKEKKMAKGMRDFLKKRGSAKPKSKDVKKIISKRPTRKFEGGKETTYKEVFDKMRKMGRKVPNLSKKRGGGRVGDSKKTYSNGGYVEGK